MIRISHVIIQGRITNPDAYSITSGNKWLGKFENLGMVHKDLMTSPHWVVDWKNGRINRWVHDFEIGTDWILQDVTLLYVDKKGRTVLQVSPSEFRFHYNIARDGTIKNWKTHKKDFISILRWGLTNEVFANDYSDT